MALTQHDIVDSIVGLRELAKDLRAATESPTVAKINPPAVPVSVQGLLRHAVYLEAVADELRGLILDCDVVIPGES